MAGNRVSSYLSSYHGMASRVGSATVANCASCHGVHNILPSSDPRSTINHANLAKTCGQCHPGANEKFITSKVHLDGSTQKADVGTKVIGFISRFYVWMIVAVIGGMVLHNLLVFRKKLALHRIGHPRILFRMTLLQRVQHLTLLISFFTLVLTGFALRYPSSWLAMAFINEHVRSLIHRIAGVVLIAVSMYPYLVRQSPTPTGGSSSKTCCPTGKTSPTFAMPCCTTSGSASNGPCSGASPMRRKRSTGRWCGACSSWQRPA